MDQKNWQLEKTINVGHLLTTLVIGLSAFSWASTVEKKVDQNALSIEFLSAEQKREERLRIDLRTEIKEDLDSINEKLDRIIESR